MRDDAGTIDAARACAREGLRRALLPFGPEAFAAVDDPACTNVMNRLVGAALAAVDAGTLFDGSEASALRLEAALTTYREALRAATHQAALVAL